MAEVTPWPPWFLELSCGKLCLGKGWAANFPWRRFTCTPSKSKSIPHQWSGFCPLVCNVCILFLSNMQTLSTESKPLGNNAKLLKPERKHMFVAYSSSKGKRLLSESHKHVAKFQQRWHRTWAACPWRARGRGATRESEAGGWGGGCRGDKGRRCLGMRMGGP